MKTLERRLGLASVAAISIAAMLGSGLFVLPGLAASYAGDLLWLAYLVSGLCVVPAALSKAELATAMPESGGTYIYIERTFGPLAGTIAGIGLWASLLLKSAFALMGFGAYLSVLAELPMKGVALALLTAVTVMNLVGVRKVGRVQMIVVVVAVTALTALAADAVFGAPVSLESGPRRTPFEFWGAVSFVFISFAGVTKVAAVAEEVENPSRNLPIGILASLGVVGGLYTVVSYALVVRVPMATLEGNLRPLYALAEATSGPGLGKAVAVLGVVTMTSMALSGLLAASRFPFAMARDGLLPRPLAYVSGRFTTPGPSILLTAGLMGAAIVSLDLASIAKLASSLMILAFMALNVTVIVLRESSAQWYKPAFRAPLYPYLQGLGVLLGLSLLIRLGWLSVVAALVSLVPGAITFLAFGRRHSGERMGVMGRMGPRQALLASEAPAPHAVLPDRAAVVVPLLGGAHSIEPLAELGAVLSGGSKVEVVYVEDLPEQMALDASVENPWAISLGRRVRALAAKQGYDMGFEAVATHDHIRLVHDISQQMSSQWLLMEWRGRTDRGVLPFNPLGWLADHLACNLAVYKDSGQREVERILVFPEPGPHDALVAITAEQLARAHAATLTLVRCVPEAAEAAAVRAEHDYLQELSALCSLDVYVKVVHGVDPIGAVAALTSEYDLLVTGAAPSRSLWSFLHVDGAERLMRRSACSALRLTAPRRLSYRAQGAGASQRRGVRLQDFLVGECVQARVTARNKAALFTHISKTFAKALPSMAQADIEAALWQRERSQNTSLGDGFAVPHATVPDAERTYLGVFTAAQPLDYRAPDGGLVDVFFVTVGPPSDRNTHLGILSSMAWLVTHTRFLEGLRSSDDSRELVAVLLASAQRGAPSGSAPEAATGDETASDDGERPHS